MQAAAAADGEKLLPRKKAAPPPTFLDINFMEKEGVLNKNEFILYRQKEGGKQK